MLDKLPLPHKGIDISNAVFRDGLTVNKVVASESNTAALWREAHEYAPANADKWEPMAAMRWYNQWTPRIPAFGCGCQNHWAELTRIHKPEFRSAQLFFEWFWARHDDVSRMHSGRPRITLDQAYELYWPTASRN